MGLDKIKIVLALLLLLAAYHFFYFHPLKHPAGILIPNAPEQSAVDSTQRGFKYKNHFIEPLAVYKISARILSIEKYWFDAHSDVAPVDWAVGWKEMSDSRVLDQLKMSQGNRFYFYNWKTSSFLPTPEVMKNTSANMHLIPSNEYIEDQIKKARVGDLVDLKGYLVRVNKKDGTEMLSSLTREDSGAGACEVMWVTDIRYLDFQ